MTSVTNKMALTEFQIHSRYIKKHTKCGEVENVFVLLFSSKHLVFFPASFFYKSRTSLTVFSVFHQISQGV